MYSIEHSILDYKFSDNDLKIFNPYLKKLKAFIDKNSSLARADLASLLLEQRNDFVSEYCFTIPCYDILKKVASYSPIVEIGAGSGYWARCLGEFGADVVAYDRFPPGQEDPWDWRSGNSWFDESWCHIIDGDESAAASHPDYPGMSIAEAHEHEQPHLMPMPSSFDGYVEIVARVSSTCLVTVKRNEAGDDEDKPLELKITKPRRKPKKKKSVSRPL